MVPSKSGSTDKRGKFFVDQVISLHKVGASTYAVAQGSLHSKMTESIQPINFDKPSTVPKKRVMVVTN